MIVEKHSKKYYLNNFLFYGFCIAWFLFFSQIVSARALETVLLVSSYVYFFWMGRGFLFNPAAILFFVSVLVVFLGYLTIDLSEYGHEYSLPSVRYFLLFFLFIPLGLIIYGDEKKSMILLSSVASGLAVAIILKYGFSGFFQEGFSGKRLVVSGNPIRDGVIASISFIFLIYTLSLTGLKKYFSMPLIILLLFYLMSIVFFQSRSALVALVVTGLYLSIFAAVCGARINRFIVPFCFVLFIVSVYFIISETGLLKKISGEADFFLSILNLDFDSIPNSSFGIRAQMTVLGIDSILERPWLGWGHNGGWVVLDIYGYHEVYTREFMQLHNSYIELAVRYGVLVLTCFLAMLYWVFRCILMLRKNRFISEKLFLFLSSVFVFLVTVINFDGFVFQSETVRLFSILLGILVGFCFRYHSLSKKYNS